MTDKIIPEAVIVAAKRGFIRTTAQATAFWARLSRFESLESSNARLREYPRGSWPAAQKS